MIQTALSIAKDVKGIYDGEKGDGPEFHEIQDYDGILCKY
jgi:hypothetical protein